MGSGCGISRMAGLTLYGSSTCPLSQSVHMTLDLLKLSYTYIEVNTDASGKHDLIAINPHNTVPVLVDDSLVITESSAAMTYLVSQHRPSKLYPEQGVKKRSQIDQRLQFNIGRFYKSLTDCLDQGDDVEDDLIDDLKEVLMWVSQMTAGGYVLGTSLTIADLAMVTTMTTLAACNLVTLHPYKNISTWLENIKQAVPHFENNCQKGAEEFGRLYKEKCSNSNNLNQKDSSIFSESVFDESEYSTDYSFSASEDGSYTPAITPTPAIASLEAAISALDMPAITTLDIAGIAALDDDDKTTMLAEDDKKVKSAVASLARQLMMVAAPAVGPGAPDMLRLTPA